MNIEILRATQLWQQTGAYSVRIQGMGRQHHISLREEFDEHDGPGTRYIVLLENQYPIATCRFYEMADDTVMVGRVVVLPQYRGNGLGKRTIVEAEQWIRDIGYAKIMLESRVEKVSFYEKLGYIKMSDEVIHGDTFDCIPMIKIL